MEKKKDTKGFIITIIVLIVLLFGAIGYICYDKGCFDKFLGKEESVQKEVKKEEPEKIEKEENVETQVPYLIYEKDYKIYAIEQHNSATYTVVVGYKGDLYSVAVSSEDGMLCVKEIAKANFDSEGNYESECSIHKFEGREDNLNKVAFSISYNSSDGAKYPIIIYKSGESESINQETNEVLKEYQINDFVSEKCSEFDGMTCKKGKLMYTVVLKDGTTKEIEK